MAELINSCAAISELEAPSAARRAISASCAVRLSGISMVRCRAYPPVARSSMRARSANAAAPTSEDLVRAAQLVAGVEAAPLAAQPLAVDQAGAGQVHPQAGTAEAIDRLVVQVLGRCAPGPGPPSAPAPSNVLIGPSAAWARCQARRSGSACGSVRRPAPVRGPPSAGDEARYTAEPHQRVTSTRSPDASATRRPPRPAAQPRPRSRGAPPPATPARLRAPAPPPRPASAAAWPRTAATSTPPRAKLSSIRPDRPRRPGQTRHTRQAEPAGQFRRRFASRQLEQRQRIAPRLRDDAVRTRSSRRPPDHRAEQLPRIALTQTPDQQFRQSPELLTRPTDGEHQRDRRPAGAAAATQRAPRPGPATARHRSRTTGAAAPPPRTAG